MTGMTMAILVSENATEHATELEIVSVACLRMKKWKSMIYYLRSVEPAKMFLPIT